MLSAIRQQHSTRSFSDSDNDANASGGAEASKIALKAQSSITPSKPNPVKRLTSPPMVMKAKADKPGNFITRLFTSVKQVKSKTPSKPALPTAKGVYAIQTGAMEADSLKTISTQSSHSDSAGGNNPAATVSGSESSFWMASTSEDHHRGLPKLIRRPQYDCFNEHDDEKLLKKIINKARKLPQNTGRYASNHIMINTERTRRNVPPLTRDRDLDRAAKEHAKVMAESKLVRHMESPAELQAKIVEGKEDADRQRLFFPRLGVNISRGKSVEDIHKFMMATLAERNNIIDKRFTTMGMATHRADNGHIYLCQVFGGP
ncbi:MAG: hypothetical protein SGILL_002863 [Bacillariaceae sp.]